MAKKKASSNKSGAKAKGTRRKTTEDPRFQTTADTLERRYGPAYQENRKKYRPGIDWGSRHGMDVFNSSLYKGPFEYGRERVGDVYNTHPTNSLLELSVPEKALIATMFNQQKRGRAKNRPKRK